jgi:N4-(beta-N-acetylglucosaminyl)-L-asparaginase
MHHHNIRNGRLIKMAVTPVIITTWRFGMAASKKGAELLNAGGTALDAIEAAANVTERDPEVNSVGLGGLPNADGVVELDGAIMDGRTHAAGSVAGITDIATPISIARKVMEVTPHTMLVGNNARAFALRNGFQTENLLTEESRKRWEAWNKDRTEAAVAHFPSSSPELTPDNHDTIGLCALDSYGNLAVGCTTSGMAWKVPGRVGDSPIIGSGLYVDNEIGGAAGTGHGDEMMRAVVSYRVVQNMERGMTPEEACIEALRYLMRKRDPHTHGNYGAALIAVRKDGLVGSAATRTGFEGPDRLWQWAVGNEECTLFEGPYVTPTETIPSLLSR